MRKFAPSLVALAAGVVWAIVFTKLIPVEADAEPPPLLEPVAEAACSDTRMIARLPDLPEASGLAVSRSQPGVIWTHNDSGKPAIFALGPDGSLRARVTVMGADVDDWEDIATGTCPSASAATGRSGATTPKLALKSNASEGGQGSCLYIGDIGDNKGARPRIAIYRVREPNAGETATQPAETFFASYPDGAKDAEALFMGPGNRLHIVTKGEGGPIGVYRFPERVTAGATAKLERVATLTDRKTARDFRITDADITWDGKWVGLRTREAVEFYRASELLRGAPSRPIEHDLSSLDEPQGEGLAFAADGIVYLASEGRDGTRGGMLARMSCKLP